MTGLRAVIRTAEGWGIENAVLTVTDMAGQQVARTVTDSKGAAATEPLPPGVYTAVITSAGFNPMARTAQIGSDGSGSISDVTLAPVVDSVELPPRGPWVIDPMHSTVIATVRHMGIASVRARFAEVNGQIVIGRPSDQSSVHAEIKAASLDSGVKMRDDHLRSPDFLDVESYPLITFASTGLRQRGADNWTMFGELTLHGQSRPIELDLRYGGYGPDLWGGVRAAFHAETQLRRNDFEINYNALVRAGVVVVGTTIRIEIDIEAVQGDKLPDF